MTSRAIFPLQFTFCLLISTLQTIIAWPRISPTTFLHVNWSCGWRMTVDMAFEWTNVGRLVFPGTFHCFYTFRHFKQLKFFKYMLYFFYWMLLLISLVTNAMLENYSWAVGHGETLPKSLYQCGGIYSIGQVMISVIFINQFRTVF